MDLKYQKPAQGIMLEKDYGDYRLYRVSCVCGHYDHDISISVEAEDIGITVTHYIKAKTHYWATPTKFYFLNSLLNRLKMTWNIWVHGYVEYETSTILSEQQAHNYAATITEAIKEVKKFKG